MPSSSKVGANPTGGPIHSQWPLNASLTVAPCIGTTVLRNRAATFHIAGADKPNDALYGVVMEICLLKNTVQFRVPKRSALWVMGCIKMMAHTS
jgi:hypothetical protein